MSYTDPTGFEADPANLGRMTVYGRAPSGVAVPLAFQFSGGIRGYQSYLLILPNQTQLASSNPGVSQGALTAYEAAFFVQTGLTLGDPVLEEASIRYQLLPIDEFVLSPLVRSGLVQSQDGGIVLIDRTEQVVRNIEMEIALGGSTRFTPVAALAKTAGITSAVIVVAIVPGPEDVAIAGALALRGGGLLLRAGAAVDDVAGAANRTNNAAHNVNAQTALRSKLSGLEKAQQTAARTRQLPDGRIRYSTKEVSARTEGPTRGASFVTEYNPKTGQVRQWMESYNHSGQVNRVHPKSLNGQTLNSQHYPPTARELGR